MPNDSGQGFYIHAMFQRDGSEGMSQIVEAHFLAACAFQYLLEPFSYIAWVDRLVRLGSGREYQR